MSIISNEAIARLHHHLADDMQRVNQVTLNHIQSKVELVQKVAQHLLCSGGKRLRPLLTIACSRLFEDQPGYAVHLAAAVEVIHSATLLHDDVIDESDLRRGQPTANVLWGNVPSILVGDFLFSKAFQLMIEAKNQRVLEVLSQASTRITEGEVLQLTLSSDLNLSFDHYLEIVGAKTASLFAAACQVGGMIVNMPAELEDDLYQFGYNLGIAFQIVDDILDYSLSREHSGKPVGNDFCEGKVTLPVLLICQSPEFLPAWEEWFNKPTRSQDEFKTAQKLLLENETLEKCYEYAQPFVDQAIQHLLKMPAGFVRDSLGCLIQSE